MISEAASYSVPPVERAFKLLRHIAGGGNASNASVTARELGFSRTTLIRLIATLEAERMIERQGSGAGYKLGPGLAALAGQALFSHDLAQAGDSVIARLAEQLGLSSHIGVLEGRDILYVARRTPNLHLVSNVRIGSRLPAHATTMGRIILAFTPRNESAALFSGVKLKAATEKTPLTFAALVRQIDADRTEGLAWSDSNFEPGIASCAGPVFDHAGRIAGGMNVTGPSHSFDAGGERRREIALAVSAAAAEISRKLGYSGAALSAPARRA